MQRLKIEYQVKVQKIKRENFLFFFGLWILGLFLALYHYLKF